MIKIGLCGASGAGKGYVSKIFKDLGVEYIDTDKIYNEKIAVSSSACVKELAQYFGDEIINEDGSLNKKQLSKRVFFGENASQHLKLLNFVTHKYIKAYVVDLLEKYEKQGKTAVVIDAPVLFESKFDKLCDVTVCVTAPLEIKLKRIIERDKITREKALARIESQLTDEMLRGLCTYEIDNSGALDMETQIKSILRELKVDVR